MNEVLAESIYWVNLPFTVLLGLVVIYWVMVGLGVLDMNLFGDVDADIHAHVEADMDVDAHPLVPGDPPHLTGDKAGGISKEISDGGGFWINALTFLNVGQVPLMFVASVLALCLWLGSMMANHYFTGGSALLALAALVPNLIVSMVATRYITLPFKPLFRRLTRENEEHVEVIGQRCTVVTSEATPEFGQVEIPTDGAPLLLNVRTMNDARFAKGDTAVVVRQDAERGIYFIAPLPNTAPHH